LHGGRTAPAAPEQGLDARFQLAQLERLGEVVISAQVEATHAVFGAAQRSEDQHGQAAAARPQAAKHLQALHAGQGQVEDQEVIGLGHQHMVGMVASAHHIDRMAALPQGLGQPFGQLLLVFDKQQTHGPPRRESPLGADGPRFQHECRPGRNVACRSVMPRVHAAWPRPRCLPLSHAQTAAKAPDCQKVDRLAADHRLA